MIAIIDYEIGNLGSVLKAFSYLDVPVVLTGDSRKIEEAEGLVLPGVGAFGEGMNNLKKLKLVEVIKKEVAAGKPLLGICLGMQLLFDGSEEDPEIEGLGLISGRVKRFKSEIVGKIPHIGWNQVEPVTNDPLFAGLKSNYFYFVHSYYPEPVEEEVVLGKTGYGKQKFASLVKKEKIWGIQCHPEKSSRIGLKMLKNFSEVVFNGDIPGN